MISQAEFQFQQRRGVPVIEVRGDLDIVNVDQFEALLDEVVVREPPGVIVSLEHATYFDSRGIHALLRLADRLFRADQRLVVVSPTGSSLRRVLDIARVQQVAPMFESVAEAVTCLTGQPD